ncbi:MAG: hypothetical protein LQ342_001684 [Letrouitia transgressa]|nr:MAG: hypothetical protein LQ342_001684 [Letrouitia transgressa]
MGCCQSTARDQTSPYSVSDANGDSSSRAITRIPTQTIEGSSPRNSSHTPSISRQPHRRRHLAPSEHFNSPLRPHIWKSKRQWTRSELDTERQEFFDTRVTGRQEIWATLRLVVSLLAEGDAREAQGILDASAITLPTGDLINGAYDEAGNLYQLPEHIISDPENVVVGSQDNVKTGNMPMNMTDDEDAEAESRREEKGKGVLKSEDLVKVKARLSDRGGPDLVVAIGKEQNVRVLVRKIQEEANLPGKGKVKIAYLGKLLRDGETLPAQGWREGHVVNALVFQ